MNMSFFYALLLFSISCGPSKNAYISNYNSINPSDYPDWLIARGLVNKATWDSLTGTLRITSDISFGGDDDIETFYFQPPSSVKNIIIASNVTVTGGFRADHNIAIKGEDRNTSLIFGTNTDAWSRGPNKVDDSPNCFTAGGDDKAADCKKWLYGAISANNMSPTDTLYVSNLTIRNARTYNITSINYPIKVDNVYMVEQRSVESNSNCDGFGGGAGSSISNSTIEVTDDAIKLYKGMTVKNVTIKLRRNGAPFQLGWGNEPTSSHTLDNVLIIGIEPQNQYNCGLFSWKSAKATTTRNIYIHKLKTQNLKFAQLRLGKSWIDAPIFEVRSPKAIINISGDQSDIEYKTAIYPNSNEKWNISICGISTPQNTYKCSSEIITGNN